VGRSLGLSFRVVRSVFRREEPLRGTWFFWLPLRFRGAVALYGLGFFAGQEKRLFSLGALRVRGIFQDVKKKCCGAWAG